MLHKVPYANSDYDTLIKHFVRNAPLPLIGNDI